MSLQRYDGVSQPCLKGCWVDADEAEHRIAQLERELAEARGIAEHFKELYSEMLRDNGEEMRSHSAGITESYQRGYEEQMELRAQAESARDQALAEVERLERSEADALDRLREIIGEANGDLGPNDDEWSRDDALEAVKGLRAELTQSLKVQSVAEASARASKAELERVEGELAEWKDPDSPVRQALMEEIILDMGDGNRSELDMREAQLDMTEAALRMARDELAKVREERDLAYARGGRDESAQGARNMAPLVEQNIALQARLDRQSGELSFALNYFDPATLTMNKAALDGEDGYFITGDYVDGAKEWSARVLALAAALEENGGE